MNKKNKNNAKIIKPRNKISHKWNKTEEICGND